MNEQLVKLEQMLKTHDWYYQMSDDHKMYTKGYNEHKAIAIKMLECEELGLKEEANTLFEKCVRRT